MPGARCARSRAWCVVNTRVSHHGFTGITRHSPRSGFNGFLRALPGDRALLPPSSAEMASANLMPASGHQDHTTSPSALALSSEAPPASTASRPAFVTFAKHPSVGQDGGSSKVDLGKARSGIFLRAGLDRLLVICPSGKLSTVCASRCGSVEAIFEFEATSRPSQLREALLAQFFQLHDDS
jgi:hypothetical protein